MTHIIRQQYLHVEVNGTESDGLALQRRLPGLCHDWLLPALERVLDRCAPPAGHLYIERLEIDAGTLSLDRSGARPGRKGGTGTGKITSGTPPPARFICHRSVPVLYSRKHAQHVIQDVFIYFLQTGSLPWSFRLPAGRTLEQVILATWQEAAESGLNPVADRRGDASGRWLTPRSGGAWSGNFPRCCWKPCCLCCPPKVRESWPRCYKQCNGPRHRRRLQNGLPNNCGRRCLPQVAARQAITAMALVGAAREVTAAGYPALASALEHHWPDVIHQTPALNIITKAPLSPSLPGADKTLITGREPPEAAEILRPEPMPPSLPGPGKSLIPRGEHPEAREGIYIDNAGLVLLHPFLPQFFAALGLAADDKLL